MADYSIKLPMSQLQLQPSTARNLKLPYGQHEYGESVCQSMIGVRNGGFVLDFIQP